MKQIKFFALALVALAMFSCSKEDVGNNPSAPGESAQIKIKLLGDGKDTKAEGIPTDDADKVIADLTVFLFRTDGTLDAKQYFGTVSATTTVTGTTSATDVFVVANTGDITGTINTKEQLLSKIAKLTAAADGTGVATQTTGKVYMSGNSPVGTFAEEGGKQVAKPSVTMHFVGAKVQVSVDVTNAKGTYGTDYEITGAFMLNTAGASKFFPATDGATMIPTETQFAASAATPYFLTGKVKGLETWTNLAVTMGEAPSLITKFANKTAVDAGAHFYVFENDNGTIRPTDKATTILVVEAKWKKAPAAGGGVEEKTMYFPVQFKAGDATGTEPILRGQAYKVAINIKGDFKEGGNGGGGTTDPGEEIKSADVVITITPASWNTKDISKDFN